MIIVNKPQDCSQHIPKVVIIGLGSCWPLPGGKGDFSRGLERAGRLRYPLPGGLDSGMPQVGCGGFRRRFCLDETVRGESNSRRHSQASIQDSADQARHSRFIDFRSNAFRVGVAARTEIGLIRLRLRMVDRLVPKPMTRPQAIALGTTRSTSELISQPM